MIEILKSTMRTREYVEKGETEGKSLLDAMRDGETEGMQDFDSEMERMIRNGTLDKEVALGYSTNPGNLRLQVADFKRAILSYRLRNQRKLFLPTTRNNNFVRREIGTPGSANPGYKTGIDHVHFKAAAAFTPAEITASRSPRSIAA